MSPRASARGGLVKYVGSALPRKEDDRFLTGRGNYVADMLPPGTLHARFVRGPYAHARITGIDAARASEAPGVVAVLTAADLKGKIGPIPPGWPIEDADLRVPPWRAMALERVRYAGEAVAVVVAQDPYLARDAADLLDVDYEPLGAVVDQEAALAPGAPEIHPEAPSNRAFRWALVGGDPDRAFREAEVVVEQRLVNQRLQPAPLETRAALAQWDGAEGRLTLWVTSQAPQDHRRAMAEALGLPEHRVRVISPDVGGGFGAKGVIYPYEAVVGYLSQKVGRPVKWVEDRTENFHATTHGRDRVDYVRMAARRDGTILGLEVRSIANLGAYVGSAGGAGIPSVAFGKMLSGCYRMVGIRAEVVGAFTNTTPVDAYRGAGRPEAAYLVERMVDILARKLSLDPAEVRRRNFIPPEAFPFEVCTGNVYDSGNYAAALEKALGASGYLAFREEQAQARREGRLLGIGLSSYVEICGFGPGLRGFARVVVHPSGRVTVYSGGHPHGQGEETTFAQVAAEELGISTADVEIVHGDTDAVPAGVGTFGSRTLAVEGSSVVMAARGVKAKARRIAAHLLEARGEDVVFDGGRFSVKGVATKALTFQEVAFAAHTTEDLPEGLGPGLEASASFDPRGLTFPFGTHVCQVEVDAETGSVRVLRYVAVDDCGPRVNPMVVEGQVQGGVLQGMAQALWEAARYDEEGNLLTSSFMEYLMPTAAEAPPVECYYTVTPSPHNPLGVKGIGEAGTIGATPAVVNAVVDALAPYGVGHLDMPITPEKVWAATRRRPPAAAQGGEPGD
jgi:carbon-monoxide dehydrogenase large subunit